MKSNLTLSMLALVFLAGACSPPASEGSPIVSTAVAESTLEVLPPPPSTVTPYPGGEPIPPEGITLQDNGKTVSMKVGDSFLLNLGSDGYDWEVSVDDQSVLRMKMGVMVIQGAQGIYDALAPGTTTLLATGSPQCLQSRPACAMPSILYTITVVVH